MTTPQEALQTLFRQRNKSAAFGNGSYPKYTIGIIFNPSLARLFLKYSMGLFDESVSFLIEAIDEKCLVRPCLLSQSKLSHFYKTYFETSDDIYGAGAAPKQLNLPAVPGPNASATLSGAEALLGPNAQIDSETRNQLGDFFIICVHDVCKILDDDKKPRNFYASKLFRDSQGRPDRGPRKRIRWGRGRGL